MFGLDATANEIALSGLNLKPRVLLDRDLAGGRRLPARFFSFVFEKDSRVFE